VINNLKDDYSIRLLCETLDVHRCDLDHQPRPDEDRQVQEALSEWAGAWPTSGDRRLRVRLRRAGLRVDQKRVRRLRHAPGICGAAPRRTPRTTDSGHSDPRSPDLVVGLEAKRPDQVWVADITYIRLRKEFIYLSVIMDVFTRCIRGWHLGRSLEQELTITALERALGRGAPGIHHSDQGVQYAATAYVELLRSRGVAISMANVGVPEENGYAERLMRTIKEEEVDLTEYEDLPDAWRQLGRFLDQVYNTKRIHSALGYLTPSEFEQQWLDGRHGC
jgi:putative transposase